MKPTDTETSQFSLPLTKLIHENLSIIMCFAYSQVALRKMRSERVAGEWKYLDKVMFSVSEERATRACLEFALFLRSFDDGEGVSKYIEQSSLNNCGNLFFKNGTTKALSFREVTNKIIHAARIEWRIHEGAEPLLICYSRDEERWIRAEIEIANVSATCGLLMS